MQIGGFRRLARSLLQRREKTETTNEDKIMTATTQARPSKSFRPMFYDATQKENSIARKDPASHANPAGRAASGSSRPEPSPPGAS